MTERERASAAGGRGWSAGGTRRGRSGPERLVGGRGPSELGLVVWDRASGGTGVGGRERAGGGVDQVICLPRRPKISSA
jgi:hypothetical protein